MKKNKKWKNNTSSDNNDSSIAFNINKARIITYNVMMVVVAVVMSLIFISLYGIHFHNGVERVEWQEKL